MTFSTKRNRLLFICMAILLFAGIGIYKLDAESNINRDKNSKLVVEQKDKVLLKLDDKSRKGEAQSTVIEGEGVSAIVTVNFTYEGDQGNFSITSIDGATAENDYGWVYVDREVTIDADHICYGAHRAEAAVPIMYKASLGASGVKEYEGLIHIDLSSVVEE